MKRFCEKFKIVVFLCHKIHAKVNMTYLLVKDDRVFTIFYCILYAQAVNSKTVKISRGYVFACNSLNLVDILYFNYLIYDFPLFRTKLRLEHGKYKVRYV